MPKRKLNSQSNTETSVKLEGNSSSPGPSTSSSKDVKAKVKSKSKTKNQGTGKEEKVVGLSTSLPTKDKQGKLCFRDYPDFKPNLTPAEVLQAGSFGGTYFRPIHSTVTGEKYKDVWKELPSEWIKGLTPAKQVASSVYRDDVNTYKVKCGGSLEMWESSGWIAKQDPYGWFQWYCRFYQGRRTEDDVRQISRWNKCAGIKGRWRNNLIAKCVRSGSSFDNKAISPVVRQTLQHWGYRLTKEDFNTGAKRVKM